MGNSNGKRSSLLKRRLEAEWEQLCETYLPVKPDTSRWRFNRALSADDPEQGWKIHISATTLTATRIFKRVAPCLQSTGVLFKAAHSLEELQRLNCGLFYGYSQVGKFMTVYTRSPAEAVELARQLDGLVGRYAAPAVPYDLRYRKNNCIFYRYGAFGSLEIKHPDGTRQSAIKSPSGELVVDQRAPGAAVPHWETNPFSVEDGTTHRRMRDENPLKTSIRVYQAISQRGKGGVYRAIDTSVNPLRLCVLKEGRRHGETDWNGRDGYWRVRHEEQVLTSLRDTNVQVPRIYTSFRCGPHYYLAMEFIEGVNLQALLNGKRSKLPISEALGYARQVARLMERIHEAGWVWRDCKPLNLIVNGNGKLCALDFEGACLVERPDHTLWGTPGYSAPESRVAEVASRLPEDLYALGATLYHIFSGQVPNLTDPASSKRIARRGLPPVLRELITSLLDTNPQSRPSARTARRILAGISL